MKKIIILLLALMLIIPLIAEEIKVKPEHLTLETFKEKIFDFENETEWNYKGEIPEGYFVFKTNTYRHWILTRPYQMPDESLEQTLTKFKETFKIYPLAEVKNPTPNEFKNISGLQYNTLHATNSQIYNELNEVIQYEPAFSGDPEMLGLAKSIGIEKGKEFKPDARMQGVLTEAASRSIIDIDSRSDGYMNNFEE